VPDTVIQSLGLIARLLEIAGAGFLILGFVIATTRWLVQMPQHGARAARGNYRQSLGRSILIGLEVLVAATIIKTITVDPTVEGMGILAVMVAIRMILGWTIVLEISGRWPWQKRRVESAPAQTES